MRIESADGTWSPADLGISDKRVFSRHGRGELIRGPKLEQTAGPAEGAFALALEGLKVEGYFKRDRKSSARYDNTVGVLVEFANVSESDEVWVYAPCLSKGDKAVTGLISGRPVPDYYRQMPRTIGKLMRGEATHILALGSSIDTGDANPRLYAYDEDPQSPTYKQPLLEGRFDAETLGCSHLKHYLHDPKQLAKYTGRLRRELMRKLNLPVSKILLNAMSCGGSCIGESHSGFADYTSFVHPPSTANGHPSGKSWVELYPDLFEGGREPAPDLVVFGHGHNERIDSPDGIAVYEGAVRWFQKRFPEVEIIFCQYHAQSVSKGNIPPIPVRKAMAAHYGIPYIDITPMMEGLVKSCNYYALAPDGGHPQAGAHYLWFKQIEQAFEMADPLQPFVEQRCLPPRFNPYTYGWEGDVVTFTAPHPRLRGTRAMIEDTAFNVWAGNDTKDRLKLVIDGAAIPRGAGNGRQMRGRNVRNSSFVHGRLSLGDRHIIEILGPGVEVHALDCKVCPNRTFTDAASDKWQKSPGVPAAQPFVSQWGAPCGDQVIVLSEGQAMAIELAATDLSIAYVDDPDGGELRVVVDGKEHLKQPTNVAFVDTDQKPHYLENRKGIRDLAWGTHRVELRAATGSVRVLGAYAYDAR